MVEVVTVVAAVIGAAFGGVSSSSGGTNALKVAR
jgi:hypothetical protein